MAFSEETIQQVWEKAKHQLLEMTRLFGVKTNARLGLEEGSTEIEIVNMVGK